MSVPYRCKPSDEIIEIRCYDEWEEYDIMELFSFGICSFCFLELLDCIQQVVCYVKCTRPSENLVNYHKKQKY